MSKVLDDINGGGTSGQDTVEFYQPEQLPRARAKRMGLPVDPNPHDHTKERDVMQTGGDKLPVWNPFEKEQQEYVDNGGVLPINGITPSKTIATDTTSTVGTGNADSESHSTTPPAETAGIKGNSPLPPRGEGFYDWIPTKYTRNTNKGRKTGKQKQRNSNVREFLPQSAMDYPQCTKHTVTDAA